MSPIFRSIPRSAFDRCVKNSVLKTQLRSGSGSWGLPIINENQSSLSFDALTALMAPIGMVRSDEMASWLLTIFCATMYTCRLVWIVSSEHSLLGINLPEQGLVDLVY